MRYTVRPGDSLSKIANTHGLAVEALLSLNPAFRARGS